MKKGFILFALWTLFLPGGHAQGLLSHLSTVDSSSRSSLFQALSGIEKKTNRFSLKLHGQGTFNGTFTDGTFEQAAFKMNQFRIEARGELNEWLSYRWRQRLNRDNSPRELDNLPASVDYAMITLKLTPQFSTSIGKQAAAYGGFEFDMDPYDIYQYSDMIDYMLFDFMTGITFSYQLTPAHELALQVVNSRAHAMHEIYGELPAGVEDSKAPLAYSINWNGSFFEDILRTRWSASLLSEAKGYNNYFYALGNELRGEKFNMYLDFYLSSEELDNRGILSSISRETGDPTCVKNARYKSWITKLNYRFHPKWNVFVQGMYENASVYRYAGQLPKGKYRTAYGYFGGIEYNLAAEDLRFFATYLGRSYDFTDRAIATGADDYSTGTIAIGFIYHIPLF